MTGIMGNLESKALVARQSSPDHARVHLFTLREDEREVAVADRAGPISVVVPPLPNRLPSCMDRLGPSTSPIVLSSKAFVRLRPAHHPITAVDPG